MGSIPTQDTFSAQHLTFTESRSIVAGRKVTVMEDIKQELLNRIIEPFSKMIACEDGWIPLLTNLHYAIIEHDPNYTIYQVKEKFGGLRFYYALSNPTVAEDVRQIVNHYEDLSTQTCEKTGLPGQLMKRNGWYKTLNEKFIDEGWTPL